MKLNVYLAGEIHTDWREAIIAACDGLDIAWLGPVTDHAASDDCGVEIFGTEEDKFWHDRKGASLNAIRTRVALRHCDVLVVCFGEKYKQWNAAFDAGYAAALDKPIIVLQRAEHDHALKEIDAAANAVARTPEEVARALRYVVTATL
jgi:YtoQ family protein